MIKIYLLIHSKVLKDVVVQYNSSSFVRDTTFSGTPVVLIGERQTGREYGKNLIKSDIVKRVFLRQFVHKWSMENMS